MEGAEFAEHVDGDADEVKKEVIAATFHCQGEDSEDMEEITEEMKQEPESRFDVKEKELFLAHDGEGYRLEKNCIKVLGAVKRSIHDTVPAVCHGLQWVTSDRNRKLGSMHQWTDRSCGWTSPTACCRF